MNPVKSHADMFQAIRGLTVQKILKIRIPSQNSCKMKAFSRFLSKSFIQLYSKKRYNHKKSHGIIRTALSILFRRKLSVPC